MTATIADGATVTADRSQRTLTTWHIVVLILAAMTPLSVVVGSIPLGLAFGGPSTAAMFVVSGIIIGIFCIGYGQMVRRINRPGAFYSYIARGLGKPAGVATATLAAVGYPITIITAATVQSVVIQSILSTTFSVDIDWRWFLIFQTVIVAALAWRHIDFNARVLSVTVAVEVVAVIALVIGIVAHHGIDVLSFDTFAPHTFKIGDWQVAFIFAILCYQGYEAGALYAPEAKRPEKTVPRALYGALFVLTGSLALLSWALTGMSGANAQMDTVVNQGFTGYIFTAVQDNLGKGGLYVFSICVIVAQIACLIGFISFTARYLNGLAKDGILPRVFASQNRHNAPGVAVLLLCAASIAIPLSLAAVGVDPYTQLSSAGFGLGAIAATAIQAVASVAVVAFFIREGHRGVALWKVRLAPLAAAVLLIAAFAIEIKGFSNITGGTIAWTAYIPWALPALWLFGIALSLYLRSRRPDVYAHLASGDTAEEAEALRAARLANAS